VTAHQSDNCASVQLM